MSINSALLAGVSGLVANSSALAAISDNIANVNTVAYKRSQVNFASVVTSQALSNRYSAGGVLGTTRHYVAQQGLIQAANSTTDLAISGDGFFIATDKSGATASDQRLFTRAGSFGVDEDGFLKNDSGLYLQGWLTQPDGTFDVSPSDLTKLSSINVKNQGAAVTPTSLIGIGANLDKATTVPVAPATTTVPPVEIKVVDEAGGSHTLALTFTKNAAAGVWDVSAAMVPATDVQTVGGVVATGQITFNTDGTIATNPDGTVDLTKSGWGAATPFSDTFTIDDSVSGGWATALNLGDQDLKFDFSNITQFADATAVKTISQNGAGPGSVVGVQVSDDGIVSAIYDNSQVRQIAKVALATFPNPDGLLSVSGNAFRATMPSGEMVIKEPGTAAAGKIASSSLEASTVDLSAEFTGLITTQKAYSASSKIISTADQMLEELINIKR